VPDIVHDVHELIQRLGTGAGQRRLIAIDGVGASGKSTLGAQLAVAIDDAVHVDLDRFRKTTEGKFFDTLRLDAVKAALEDDPRTVITTGICMLRVLDAVKLRPDVLIYVKRMRPWGWSDEAEVEGDDDVEEGPYQVEVRHYHRTYRPHDRAEIILERLDKS